MCPACELIAAQTATAWVFAEAAEVDSEFGVPVCIGIDTSRLGPPSRSS